MKCRRNPLHARLGKTSLVLAFGPFNTAMLLVPPFGGDAQLTNFEHGSGRQDLGGLQYRDEPSHRKLCQGVENGNALMPIVAQNRLNNKL